MLVDKSFFIKGCDDFELGIKRKSKLEYRLSYDDEKELGAIVFINAGFGSVANISFMDFTRKNLAKKFPIIAVNVFYHCFSNRFSDEEAYSANLMMDEVDLCRFKDIVTQFGLDFSPQTPFKETMEQIEQIIIEQKKQKKLPKNMILNSLTANFYPPNGDYQNFGIMAAMDHIYALKHLYALPEFCGVRTRGGGGVASLPKIYGGSSYGGYLAHLIAKIAPWHTQGVIDSACSPVAQLQYLVGKELDATPEYTFETPHIWMRVFTKTLWTRKDASSPYFFSNAHFMIRTLLNSKHIQIQATHSKECLFVSYHGLDDEFKTAEDKIKLYKAYEELGLDATLHLIDEDKIDGKFIKNKKHGCGISDRGLFEKELPALLERLKGKDFTPKDGYISYPCEDKIFTFKDDKGQFKLEISQVKSANGGGGGVNPATKLIRVKNPLKP